MCDEDGHQGMRERSVLVSDPEGTSSRIFALHLHVCDGLCEPDFEVILRLSKQAARFVDVSSCSAGWHHILRSGFGLKFHGGEPSMGTKIDLYIRSALT